MAMRVWVRGFGTPIGNGSNNIQCLIELHVLQNSYRSSYFLFLCNSEMYIIFQSWEILFFKYERNTDNEPLRFLHNAVGNGPSFCYWWLMNGYWYCLCFCRCGLCGRACVTSMGSQSTAAGTAAPSAGHHRKRQPADLWTSRSAAWAPPVHSNLHQQLCLELRQPNPEVYEQSPLSGYLRWAEFLSKQPDDELHQAHVVFITQRVKVGTGDDNDLLGMSIQPDGEFLEGLLHTYTHTRLYPYYCNQKQAICWCVLRSVPQEMVKLL